MPLLSPHVREQIRAASDIVEVITRYLPLKKAGGNFVALCPFHREKTPSFHVSPSRQAYHCFGCHKGGDVFRFVQDYENISFTEASKRLAERAGIRLEFDESPGQREDRAIKEELRDIHEQATRRWQQVLANDAAGQAARDYLAKRGLAAEAIQRFRLGCAPDNWEDTVNWARSKGWNLSLVEQAGLIIARDAGDQNVRYYDRFRGRLMFPIADEQSRVIGFSGRILSGDEKVAKYVNSPETPIFTKSRVLYGLDQARRAILDANSAIVCEGQLDLIAAHMAGVQNMVAPQGTALTADHLRILGRYASEVVLCFDSDNAGQKAAARILDDLLTSGLAIRVITIPAPHDPDSFIREHGGEAFRRLTGTARDFFEFYLEFLCRGNDVATDRGQMAVIENMAVALGKTDNQVLIDRYAQRTSMAIAAAARVAPSPDAVRAEFRKRARRRASPGSSLSQPTGPQSDATELPAAPPAPPPTQEFWLLKLLFLNDEFAGWLALHLDFSWLRHPHVKELVRLRLEAHHEATWQSHAAFLGGLEDDPLRSLASEAMSDSRSIPNPEQQLNDVVLRLRNSWLDEQIAGLALRVSIPDRPDAERDELLRRLQDLRRAKREPLLARILSETAAGSVEANG